VARRGELEFAGSCIKKNINCSVLLVGLQRNSTVGMDYAGSTYVWKAHLFQRNSYGSTRFGRSEEMNQLIIPGGKFADRSRYNDSIEIDRTILTRLRWQYLYEKNIGGLFINHRETEGP